MNPRGYASLSRSMELFTAVSVERVHRRASAIIRTSLQVEASRLPHSAHILKSRNLLVLVVRIWVELLVEQLFEKWLKTRHHRMVRGKAEMRVMNKTPYLRRPRSSRQLMPIHLRGMIRKMVTVSSGRSL